jgi:hypothetical protein
VYNNYFISLITVGQKRKSESESESGVKQICLTPPASRGLVEVPKQNSKIFSISTPCTGSVPSPTFAPATAMSAPGIMTSQPLPVQQQQAPIFIIYAGQQHMQKTPTSHISGKPLLQNSQILNEAALLQAQHAGQAIQVIGNGLPPQAQIVVPTGVNGIQKRELPTRHIPAVINGQNVFQAPPPTLININGTTALLQQNGHPTTILPPQTLVNEAVTIAPSISPPHLPHRRHGIPKNPISISHRMISETKTIPPPLVQVKEEAVTDSCITVGTSSNHVAPLPVSSTSTSATQISPKMAVLPFSLLQDSIRGPSPTRPSLPYILVNDKQTGDSSRHIFVKPPAQSSSSSTMSPITVPPVNMPIYRFSTLNNVQPLQILTSVPSHDSCVTLPDFIKQDTIAH